MQLSSKMPRGELSSGPSTDTSHGVFYTLISHHSVFTDLETFLQTSPCLIFAAGRQRRGNLETEDKVNYKLPIK